MFKTPTKKKRPFKTLFKSVLKQVHEVGSLTFGTRGVNMSV